MNEKNRRKLFEQIDIGVREGIAKAIDENKKIKQSSFHMNQCTARNPGEIYCVYQIQFFDRDVVIQGDVQEFDTYQAAQEYIDQKKNKALRYPWVILKRTVTGLCEFLDLQR